MTEQPDNKREDTHGVDGKDEGRQFRQSQDRTHGNGPEPPVGWTQQAGNQDPIQQSQPESRMAEIGKTTFQVQGFDVREFDSARNFVLAAQVGAVVSLFFGGALLSAIALVLAFVGRSKLARIAQNVSDEAAVGALMRSGTVAVVMSALALALNIVSIIVLMPLIEQVAQTGDYSLLFGSLPGTSAGTGSSGTWG